MFRVKICGITSVADAQAAVAAGADAIGINFYARSPRYCEVPLAREIAAAVPSEVCKVGVFVNTPAAEVLQIREDVGLDLVQLHGDEAPTDLGELRSIAVMRALRVGSDLTPVASYLDECHRLVCVPRMLLLDATRDGQYGGTGVALDWQALAAGRAQLRGLPLVLAGGLTCENVAA